MDRLPPLATERLALTAPSLADAAFVLELLNDPGWIRNIGDRGVRDVEGAAAYIRERFGAGRWWVVRNGAGEPVGMCGLIERAGLDVPDIGYAYLRRHSGRGYATEAARAVLAFARDVLKLPTVCAITDPDNTASQHVLQKIGLRYVDTRQVAGVEGLSAYFETIDESRGSGQAPSNCAARGAK
jgi:RimJ/RimL family protein N-acetyltransferase